MTKKKARDAGAPGPLQEFDFQSQWLVRAITWGLPLEVVSDDPRAFRLESVAHRSEAVLVAAAVDGYERAKKAVHSSIVFEPYIVRGGLASEVVEVVLRPPYPIASETAAPFDESVSVDARWFGNGPTPEVVWGSTAYRVASLVTLALARHVIEKLTDMGAKVPGWQPYRTVIRSGDPITNFHPIPPAIDEDDRRKLAARVMRERILALTALGYDFPKPVGGASLVTLSDIAGWLVIERTSINGKLMSALGPPVVEFSGRSPALYDRDAALRAVRTVYPKRRLHLS